MQGKDFGRLVSHVRSEAGGSRRHHRNLYSSCERPGRHSQGAVSEKKGFLKKIISKRKRTTPGMLVLVAWWCTSKEAWMCGCCGKVFSTFCAADDHEKRSIRGLQDTGGAVTHDDDDNDGSHLFLFGIGQINTRHWRVSNLVLAGVYS